MSLYYFIEGKKLKLLNLSKLLKKKETEAKRIYNIYRNADVEKRINNIVNLEFRKMIFEAEKTALNGETSFTFIINIEDKDMIYFNKIISDFINLLTEEGFTYSRELLKNRKQFSIYFSQHVYK